MSSVPPEHAAHGDDMTLLHRTLAELLEAEVPLARAFTVLEKDLDDRRLQDAVRAMAHEVETGTPLYEAYDQRGDTFPAPYRALVAAGAASGDVAGTFGSIAEHAALDAQTRRRVKKALAAPTVTGLFVLVLGTLALVFALPRLWAFVERVGGDSPAPIAFGALALLVAVLFVFVLLAWRGRRRFGTIGNAWPVLGPIRRERARATIASTLALLVRREIPLDRALELTAGTTGDDAHADALRAAAAHAREGATLAEALDATALFDRGAVWLIQGAEATGDTARALDEAARLHARRLERKLDRFTLLVRPAAELTLGLVVFAFAFSYMLPIFEFTSGILGGGY